MPNSSNVDASSLFANKPRLASIPPALVAVRDCIQAELPSLLHILFDNVDDALFKLAEKAEINAEQNIYFGAMREIRLKRRTIEANYLAAMREVFHLEPVVIAPAKQSATEKLISNMGLMQNDQLEETIVFEGMIDKANKQFHSIIGRVTSQINQLLPEHVLDERNSPLSMRALCECFVLACECLTIDTKEKIILYKLFDKHIIIESEHLFHQAHSLLLEGGVAPLAKPTKESLAISEVAVKTAALSDVLDNLKASLEKNATLFGSNKNKSQELNKYELVAILSELQRKERLSEQLEKQESFDMVVSIKTLLKESNIEGDCVIEKEAQQTITLVRMLFKFMLDVKNLSDVLQQSIMSLHVPVLKAALLDDTFLSREGHPVRRLLSELTKAAIELGPDPIDERDPTYRKMLAVSHQVINGFDDDLSIFPELVFEFSSFVSDERKRRALIAQRVKGAKEGLARSDKAREFVKNFVDDFCKNKALPPVVIDVLNGPWSNVLFLIYLKEGDQSSAWAQAMETAQKLVASVRAEVSRSDRYQLLMGLPDLLKSLQVGLSSVGCAPQDIAQFFSELEQLHLQHYQVVREKAAQRLVNKPLLIQPTVSATENEIDYSKLEVFNSNAVDAAYYGHVKSSEAQAILETIEAHTTVSHEEAKQCMKALCADMWVELYEQDKKRRCKIAAILKPARTFIFVDRDGKKIAEKSAAEVVSAIEVGDIKMLDNNSLFGRAFPNKPKP